MTYQQRRRASEWRHFRRRFHFSQGELAKQLGLHVTAVWRVERGITQPRESTLRTSMLFKQRHEDERRLKLAQRSEVARPLEWLRG